MRKKIYFCIVKDKYQRKLFSKNQLFKRIGKILLRVVLACFLLVYVVVALLNYSVVQSIVGSFASDYFSNEWGGKVRVGSMGCNPMNHLVLRNVELINPGDDTIFVAGKLALRFDGFPYDSHGLRFSKVELKDVLYHLNIDSSGINLKYIIDYYSSGEEIDEVDNSKETFKVLVDDLILDNVTYRQDLNDSRTAEERLGTVGVDVMHMEYREIYGRFRNVRVDEDRVTCRMDRFRTVERSGLQVKELRCNVYATQSGISTTNFYLETADSKLTGDVLLDYRHWDSMGEFLDSVYFTVHFDKGSYGGMQDAAYWAHDLWGMDERIELEGDYWGPISDFHAENVKLGFGDETEIELDAYIYGLPNIDTTIIGAEIHHLHTTYEDLAAVRHPVGVKMQAEKIVKALNRMDLEATFTGTIWDFYATFSLLCDQGDVEGDVIMSMNPAKKEYRYTGQISSKGFGIGRIAPNEWVSRGGFDLNFEGNGFDPKTMNASADGQLHHLVVRGQRIIGEVALEADATGGLLTVDASLDDVLAQLSVHGEGDWREDVPVLRATVDAQQVDLMRFGLWKEEVDSAALLSLQGTFRHSKRDDANSSWRVGLTDVHLLTSSKDVKMKSFSLLSRKQNYWMNTSLRSDVADATLRGYYEYATLPMMLEHIVDEYLPECLLETERMERSLGRRTGRPDISFEFNMEWKDTAELLRSFVPKLGIAKGTTIQANYNYADGFKPIIRSDSLSWGNLSFYDIGINAEGVADHYRLQMKSDRLMLGQIQFMDYGTLRLESSREGMNCRLYWQNSSKSVGGGDVSLRLLADSSRLHLMADPSHLALGGRDWQLFLDGDNYLTSNFIHIDRLGLSSDDEQFQATVHSGMGVDSIALYLTNLGLEVVNPFIAASGMTFGGYADGSVTHSQVTTGQLYVSDLIMNGENLGDINIVSLFDDKKQRLNVTAQSDEKSLNSKTGFTIQLDGYAMLAKDNRELHLDGRVGDLGLGVIKPFVTSFSSDVGGKLSFDLALRGTVEEPKVTGQVVINDGRMKVDYINVEYGFSDTIAIDGDAIQIDDLVVRDPDGGLAHIKGKIEHHNFDDFMLKLRLTSPKLLCMNTTAKDNSDFFGRIVASAEGRVMGPVNNLDITVNARTLEGTMLSVPINDNKQMKQVDYIHFVNEEMLESEIQDEAFANRMYEMFNQKMETDDQESRYSVQINVEATPEMQFLMPMTFSTVDVNVMARGNGDLQMKFGTGRSFGLAGDYEISDGTLLLDLLGIVSKEFTIENGSTITLPGNVQGAMFDIRAVLSQRVNLSTLTGSLSGTDSQKPVQVENIIALNGTLRSPNVSFDIRLPNADQSVQEEVFSYIDRSNERDMLNQTVSLLVSKRFYNASAGNATTDGASTNNQAYGLVLGTIGGMISDMVQVVDVNFDYQSGNGLTTDQYAVDISKEWNKFYFESSFGFGGENREVATSGEGTNNMTGDMLVGYKINPRLHLFVFNRSNTNDYTRSDLPYKQGIGLKYTRDFDRMRELFFWRKKP